ncbi:GLPGLI family protein [Aequorivita sinensis]|uniref:GLPGLI family protein n=1 Tax=Aequorivita sinensis TaxID=1382458 RepID=UPI00230181EA|nr:GLPGLI family protein [Aequorivita sinensis]
MNKTLPFLLLIFSLSISAQNLSGKAYYKSNTNSGKDYSNLPEENRLRFEKMNKELYEKSYMLTFNNNESIYKEEEILKETSMYMQGVLAAMESYSIQSIYKNHDTHRIMEEREFLGKKFLIDDTLPKLDWQLEKESKQIGDYIVFKATATRKVDLNDYRAQALKNNDSIKKQKKAYFMITAWYTPQIPISNGPDEYSGLPGLILELNVGRTTFLCHKIILSPANDIIIKQPKSGQVVTFDEFDKIAEAKKKELKNKF